MPFARYGCKLWSSLKECLVAAVVSLMVLGSCAVLHAQTPSAPLEEAVPSPPQLEAPSVNDTPKESAAHPRSQPSAASARPGPIAEKPLPRDLSPWGMFVAADIVVKAVMIGLLLASLLTWTIWAVKAVELARARRRLRAGIAQILPALSLGEALSSFENNPETAAILLREAADEVRISAPALGGASAHGINERVTSRLSRAEAKAGQRMMAGTGMLATIGATAPFVGLFGTVWGIMNAFIGISESQTTNLAVVAPGIAEALLATAFGLVAAIPAVIIYNAFARSIMGYRRLLGDASAGIERLVSRDLDMQRIATVARAPTAAE